MSPRGTRNLIFGLLALGVALFVFLVFSASYVVTQSRSLAHQNQRYIACIVNWANETNHRSAELTGAARTRQDALDRVVRDVAEGQNPNKAADARARFQRDIRDYVKASDAYNKTLHQHPIPKSPKLACANVKK